MKPVKYWKRLSSKSRIIYLAKVILTATPLAWRLAAATIPLQVSTQVFTIASPRFSPPRARTAATRTIFRKNQDRILANKDNPGFMIPDAPMP